MSRLGQYILFLGVLFKNRESFATYFKLTIDECIYIGLNSIVIVSLVSVFMGAVSTVQTAYNLLSPLIPQTVIGLVVRISFGVSSYYYGHCVCRKSRFIYCGQLGYYENY